MKGEVTVDEEMIAGALAAELLTSFEPTFLEKQRYLPRQQKVSGEKTGLVIANQ